MEVLFKSDWSKITAISDKVVEIDIDGYIGPDWWVAEDDQNTKERMKAELKAIDDIKASKIIVNINSYGGDVNHGISIHDLLKSNKAEVETRVNGMTASAATIIAQAGDVRTMSDNSLYLIHNSSGIVWGNKKQLESTIKDLEKVDGIMSNLYAKRSGKSSEHFENLMNESNGEGVWLDADEALEKGLIDSKFEPTAIAASAKFDHSKYGYPSYENKLKSLNMSKEKDNVEKDDTKVDSFVDRVLAKIIPKKDKVKSEISEEDIQAIADVTTAQVDAAIAEKDEEIEEITSSKDKEISTLKAKIAKMEAKGTTIKSGEDTVNPEGDPECSAFATWAANKIKKKLGVNQ